MQLVPPGHPISAAVDSLSTRAHDDLRLEYQTPLRLALIVEVVCLAEAGVTTALAFSLTTGAFLVTSRVVR